MSEPIAWPVHLEVFDAKGQKVRDMQPVLDAANAAQNLARVLRLFRERAEAGQHVEADLIQQATAALAASRI
jgi:hypothetical protein